MIVCVCVCVYVCERERERDLIVLLPLYSFQPSRLPRAAGTFAGLDSGYKKPQYSRFQSEDALSRYDH